jgi:hypothetical protein
MTQMSTYRPTPVDDHGDQFPGAVPPAGATARRSGAGDTLPRMRAAYVHEVDDVVGSGNDDLALELAEAPTGTAQTEYVRRTTGRGAPSRDGSGRPPGSAGTRLRRVGGFTRRSLDRFDRYTLDVFNAGTPRRPQG